MFGMTPGLEDVSDERAGAGPIFSAHREKRSARPLLGEQAVVSRASSSGTVVCRPGEWERTWLATRCPWWKSSTVWAVYRAWSWRPTRAWGTE